MDYIYHATTSKNADKILRNKKFDHIAHFKKNQIKTGMTGLPYNPKKNPKSPGTLGFGLYFFDKKDDAEKYCKRHSSCECIISCKIDFLNKKYNFINFNDDTWSDFFWKWIGVKRSENKFIFQILSKFYKDDDFQKSLTGALIDLFIIDFETVNKTIIHGVMMKTKNKLLSKDLDKYLLNSPIPNSFEICIKENSVIRNETINRVK